MIRLYKVPAWLKTGFSGFLWDKKEEHHTKKVYLTFDDGPVPDITEQVLGHLRPYGAKATFFCVGDNIRKHPQVFQKLLKEGHFAANHTFRHLNGWNTPLDIYLDDVARCQKLIDEFLPRTISTTNKPLFRPPYGRILSKQARKIKQEYQIVMWSLLTHDYDASLQPEQCLKKTIHYTHPGAVVVFHDSLKAQKNMLYVLPRYLDYLAEAGYECTLL